MFDNLFDTLTSPAAIAVIVAALATMRGLGDLLIKVGNSGKYAAQDNDWFDSAGAFLKNLTNTAGKILSFIGIGNRQK